MKRTALIAAAFVMLAMPAVAAQDATPNSGKDRFMQMQSMMDQARKAATPAERQKVMQDHMKAMQEQMAAMHGMMGEKGMTNDAGQNTPLRMRMMERMDQMQQMMEQMLGQQEMMMTPPK